MTGLILCADAAEGSSRDDKSVFSSRASLTASPSGSVPRRRRRAVVTTILIGAFAGVIALGLVAVDRYGPRFGLYLVPPSPQKYAEVAVEWLDGGYHTDDPEWPAARAAVLEASRSARSSAELSPVLEHATRVAGGRHSRFLTAEEASSAPAEDVPPPTVTSEGGVTTIVLPEMISPSPDDQHAYAATVADGIDRAAADTCGWVIDLRGNTGGNMAPMLSGVVALLPDGPALSFRSRQGGETPVTIGSRGVAIAGSVSVDVGPRAKVAAHPIAVLQDDGTASSGEAVLAAFRGVDGARTFGVDSAGYTSANVSRTLYDGATLVLTESEYVDRTGHGYAEGPIAPDERTPADAADTRARAWLRDQSCAQ